MRSWGLATCACLVLVAGFVLVLDQQADAMNETAWTVSHWAVRNVVLLLASGVLALAAGLGGKERPRLACIAMLVVALWWSLAALAHVPDAVSQGDPGELMLSLPWLLVAGPAWVGVASAQRLVSTARPAST